MSSDQLDLFADSRDVALRNDLAAALSRGDVDTARRVAAELLEESPSDHMLGPTALLTDHLERQRTAAPSTSSHGAATIVAARHELEQRLAPAARGVFEADVADRWISSQWCRLAREAAGVAWHADHADAHAAALYVQARAWNDVDEAVRRIESWHRVPQPLSWMALARWHAQGPDAAWPRLVEALWLAPALAQATITAIPDVGLHRLAAGFVAAFDPDAPEDWAWMPAWLLVEQPLLADVLRSARTDADDKPVRGFELMQAVLRLERQGRHHELIEHRRRLRMLSEPLFAAYMRTR